MSKIGARELFFVVRSNELADGRYAYAGAMLTSERHGPILSELSIETCVESSLGAQIQAASDIKRRLLSSVAQGLEMMI